MQIFSLLIVWWMGVSEILLNWLLKRSKYMEIQWYFLPVFLLRKKLTVCFVEAKTMEVKQLLNLIL